MREFKFRAWDITHEQYCNQGFEGRCFEWIKDGQYFIIEQFTGLQDKNGVDVYEGDILSRDSASFNVEIGVAKIIRGCCMVSNEESDNYYNLYHYILGVKVIGNIHENKDL